MPAKRLEFQEGFPVEKSIYFEEYSGKEIEGMKRIQLEEQLEIEKKRYHAIQKQIDSRRGNLKIYQGRPEDSGRSLDASEIAKLEKEKDLRAENIVKICSRLEIGKIDLRSEARNENVYQKAA